MPSLLRWGKKKQQLQPQGAIRAAVFLINILCKTHYIWSGAFQESGLCQQKNSLRKNVFHEQTSRVAIHAFHPQRRPDNQEKLIPRSLTRKGRQKTFHSHPHQKLRDPTTPMKGLRVLSTLHGNKNALAMVVRGGWPLDMAWPSLWFPWSA